MALALTLVMMAMMPRDMAMDPSGDNTSIVEGQKAIRHGQNELTTSQAAHMVIHPMRDALMKWRVWVTAAELNANQKHPLLRAGLDRMAGEKGQPF